MAWLNCIIKLILLVVETGSDLMTSMFFPFLTKLKFAIKLTHVLICGANGFGNTAIGRLHCKFLQMTCTTHQSPFVRITSLIRFVSQLHATFLADITIDMKIFIHWYHTYRFFGTFHRRYTFEQKKWNGESTSVGCECSRTLPLEQWTFDLPVPQQAHFGANMLW